MQIKDRKIGDNNPCFIIAEAALAHGGKFENAVELIDMAVEANCDAVKFQIYKTGDLVSPERSPEWFERMKRKELPYSDFKRLQEYAGDKILWFATPHTEDAFNFLKTLNPPMYKIGSGEHDQAFIDKVSGTGKPLLISTGLRTHFEVLNLIERYGDARTAFLHCVTAYPVPEHLLGLGFIETLKQKCAASRAVPGYSDHSEGTQACEIAVAMGAKIIEKHICLESSEGQDVSVSLKGKELMNFVKKVRRIERMVGDRFRNYSPEEKVNEAWALKSQSDNRRPL